MHFKRLHVGTFCHSSRCEQLSDEFYLVALHTHTFAGSCSAKELNVQTKESTGRELLSRLARWHVGHVTDLRLAEDMSWGGLEGVFVCLCYHVDVSAFRGWGVNGFKEECVEAGSCWRQNASCMSVGRFSEWLHIMNWESAMKRWRQCWNGKTWETEMTKQSCGDRDKVKVRASNRAEEDYLRGNSSFSLQGGFTRQPGA